MRTAIGTQFFRRRKTRTAIQRAERDAALSEYVYDSIPTFSWRAWAIGAATAAFVGALLYWATPFKPIPALVMGFIAGGAGTMGEFVMKALKRDAGVRNWGGKASVTGAVGLLDRVAPLCFAAPVFFHAVRWYFGL